MVIAMDKEPGEQGRVGRDDLPEPGEASQHDPWEGFKTISGLKGIPHDGQHNDGPEPDKDQAKPDA
jgi:hypothetical protein